MKRFWKINIFTGFLALFSGLLTTNANPGIRLRFTDKGLMLGECLLVSFKLFSLHSSTGHGRRSNSLYQQICGFRKFYRWTEGFTFLYIFHYYVQNHSIVGLV